MNTQIYEEASEWIILHRSDGLDADARRRFDVWLRESPQHLRAYLEMSTIWEDVPALHGDPNTSADLLIARALQDSSVIPFGDLQPLPSVTEPATSGAAGLGATRAKNRTPRFAFQIAASLLLVAVAIASWLTLQRGIYTTDIGEQRTLALTDGSTVVLNAESRIRVAYTGDQRTIQLLRGQALFKVAKDPDRPFVVDTNVTQIRAVGTQFDVYKKGAGTQVTVVEGRVAVAAGRAPETPRAAIPAADKEIPAADQHASALRAQPGEVLLSAGEQIFLAEATPTREGNLPPASRAGTVAAPVPQPADVEAATAWTQQRLVFDFTPLVEVAREFNRYNRRPLIIDDSGLETFNVSGSFSSTDPTLLLRFLRAQPGIVVKESADDIRISRHEASSG